MLISGTCRNCNQSFERPYNTKDRGLFCGKSCAASWNNRNRKKVSGYQCPTCGTQRKNKHEGDCWLCQKAARLAIFEAMTIAELREQFSTLAFHAKVRRWARAVYSGEMCCEECGYDRHAEICHLRPVASFPPSARMAEVNDPGNLVALCPNHHWELDAGVLDLTRGEMLA